MIEPLLVGVGGVLGAWARHLTGETIETTALDTLAVNVVGSFLLGVVLAAGVGDAAVALVGIGFCGAFTTFSSFAVETVSFYQSERRVLALGNAVVNLLCATLAVGAGMALAGLAP